MYTLTYRTTENLPSLWVEKKKTLWKSQFTVGINETNENLIIHCEMGSVMNLVRFNNSICCRHDWSIFHAAILAHQQPINCYCGNLVKLLYKITIVENK